MSVPTRLDHWREKRAMLEACFEDASPPLKWVFALELSVVDELIAYYEDCLAHELVTLH